MIHKLIHLAQLPHERGGYILLKGDRPKLVIEATRGTKRSYQPTQHNLSVRHVLRFHTHPDKTMETPPSDQDYVQTCKDYVQRGDGIPYHLVVCPSSFFLLEIPKHVRKQLDEFIAANTHKSGVDRKMVFMDTPLFESIERVADKMVKYQECYDDETRDRCVRKYIRNIHRACGVPITWINVSKV
jgi:hypothetical protein